MIKKRLFSVILMSTILTFASSVNALASDSKQTNNSQQPNITQQQTTLLQPGQDGYVGALNNRPSNVFIPSSDKTNASTDSTNKSATP